MLKNLSNGAMYGNDTGGHNVLDITLLYRIEGLLRHRTWAYVSEDQMHVSQGTCKKGIQCIDFIMMGFGCNNKDDIPVFSSVKSFPVPIIQRCGKR